MQRHLTVRFPPELHDRLVEHKRATGVQTAEFVRRAAEEKLLRDGFDGKPVRPRKTKQSA